MGTSASQPRKHLCIERAEEEDRDGATGKSEFDSHRTSEEPQYLQASAV